MIQQEKTLDEGVVRCNQCSKTRNVTTRETLLEGWPRCCGLVMMLIPRGVPELALAPEEPIPPHAPDSETSRDAAIFIRTKAAALRMTALHAIITSAHAGLTDHELVKYTGVIKDTIAARRSELKKAGFVRARMENHQTVKRTSKVGERTTRPSTVWVATYEGYEEYARLKNIARIEAEV